MKTATSTYKMQRALGDYKYEMRISQGNVTYNHDRIKSVTIHPSLTAGSGITIGGTNSAECRITVLEASANWARMAKFTVDFRISSTGGGTTSE